MKFKTAGSLKWAASRWKNPVLRRRHPIRCTPMTTRQEGSLLQTRRSRTMSTNITAKRDYRQEVTDNIVRMLEEGTSPWQKPWRSGALEMPFNPTSDRQYRGANAINLMAAGVSRGYDDPRWMTYRQAQEKGWQVREGEKGTAIEYWEFAKGAAAKERTEVSDDSLENENKNNSRARVVH